MREPSKRCFQLLVQFLVHGFEMILHILGHAILPHRQRQVRSPLEDGQMGYLFRVETKAPVSVLLVGDMDSDVAYLWSDLLSHLDAARASTDDADPFSGRLDTFFWPPTCMTAWPFECVASFDVGCVGLGCETLGDPVMGPVGRK